MVVNNNYNGVTANIDSTHLENIRAIDASKIPDEIVYFKPRNSPEEFIAQEEICIEI